MRNRKIPSRLTQEKVLCPCGCRQSRDRYDINGYERRFIPGHNIPQIHGKGVLAGNWRGGIITDDRGYILVYQPQHPNASNDGYVREHRLIMEKFLGRYLNDIESVHHKNGIKDDNRIENLQLTDNHSEHMKLFHPNAGMNTRFKKGHVHSEEWKKRISLLLKGKPHHPKIKSKGNNLTLDKYV